MSRKALLVADPFFFSFFYVGSLSRVRFPYLSEVCQKEMVQDFWHIRSLGSYRSLDSTSEEENLDEKDAILDRKPRNCFNSRSPPFAIIATILLAAVSLVLGILIGLQLQTHPQTPLTFGLLRRSSSSPIP